VKDSHELIAAYLDDTLDAAQQAELVAWLRADAANLRTFTDAVMFEQQLREAVRAAAAGKAAESFVRVAKRDAGLDRPRHRRLVLAACAAGVALLAGWLAIRPKELPPLASPPPMHGTTFALAQTKGKVVALHFLLKTECPYCLKLTHDYAVLAATTPNVVHVFLKPDSAEEIQRWVGKLDKSGLTELPVIYRDPDAKLAENFGIPDGYRFHGQVVHFPALVVLDGKGKELFRYVGKSNADRMSTAGFTAKLTAVTGKGQA